MANQHTPVERRRSARLQINLTPDEYDAISELAERTGRSKASLCRAAIRVYTAEMHRIEVAEVHPTTPLYLPKDSDATRA